MGTKDGDTRRLRQPLKSILDDPNGSECKDFESYLKNHGNFSYLEFIWACQGMKALVKVQDTARNKQLVTCLYRQYILNGSLSSALSNNTFLKIVEKISHNFDQFSINNLLDFYIFNDAENEVEEYLSSVVYPQFLKDFNNGDIRIENDNSGYLKCNNKSIRRCGSIIINEDGLPQLPLVDEKSFPDISCHKAPNEPEVFAKQLSQKLEALQKNIDHERVLAKCTECQKEELEMRQCFSTKLSKAIEAKLVICNANPKEVDAETIKYESFKDDTSNLKRDYEKNTTRTANMKTPKNKNHRGRKKNRFMIKNLCGLNPTTVKDDSISLLSFNSTDSNTNSFNTSNITAGSVIPTSTTSVITQIPLDQLKKTIKHI